MQNATSSDHGRPLNRHEFTQTSGTGHAWGRFSQCEAHSVLSFLWKGTALKVWKQTNTRVRNEHHLMPRSRLFLCISHIVIVRFCILYFMSTLAGVTRDLFHMSPLPVNDTIFFLFFHSLCWHVKDFLSLCFWLRRAINPCTAFQHINCAGLFFPHMECML